MAIEKLDRRVLRLAERLSFVAAVTAVVTVWSGLQGDIRIGLFPFGVAATVLLLAVVPQAVLRVHRVRPRRSRSSWSVVGGRAEGVVEAAGQVAGIAVSVTSLAFVGIAVSKVAQVLAGSGMAGSEARS